ncbi:hypothetical protein Ancab_012309 [Ancistrocladus abbreviatus]
MELTNNFGRIIGKGGFGTVYFGSLKDGTQVAVKILDPSSTVSLKLFQTEVQLLMRVHHRHLVSLVGYCDEGKTMALICEYMANGNLHEHLSEKNVSALSWQGRLQIAVGTAQGLEYLHNGCKPPIIHRDLKAANILLDNKLQAKISDFGLSRILSTESQTHVSTVVAGTHGYLDPEYFNSLKLNEKSDVYSFGVVLLELITGLPAIIRGSDTIHLVNWVKLLLDRGDIHDIIDPRLHGCFDINSAWKALEIAMACVPPTAVERPNMSQILMDLKECLAIEVTHEQARGLQHGASSSQVLEIAAADTEIAMGPTPR